MPASVLGTGVTTLTFLEKPNFTAIVVPKQVLSSGIQEADPHTESRYLSDLQFCAERRAG